MEWDERLKWEVSVLSDNRVVIADNGVHDVWLYVTGDFESLDQKLEYSNLICEKLNYHPIEKNLFTPPAVDIQLSIRNAIKESIEVLLKEDEMMTTFEQKYRQKCVDELQKYWRI